MPKEREPTLMLYGCTYGFCRSPEFVAKVRSMFAKGKKAKEISNAIGCSLGPVYKVLSMPDSSLERRDLKTKITDTDITMMSYQTAIAGIEDAYRG